jgi:Kef-type K+ transport system membrane component KefB
MLTAITLLALVVAATLLAHFVLGRAQARFLYTTGGEYILLGVLVGPQLPALVQAFTGEPLAWQGLVDAGVLRQLAPLISLAIGWAGLVYGLQFDLRAMLNSRSGAFTLSTVQAAATFALVYIVGRWVLAGTGFLGLDAHQASQAALFLGATAAVSSPAAWELVHRRFPSQGRHSKLLQDGGTIDELVGIFVFGLIFCLYHPAQESGLGRPPTPTEWYVVMVLLGLVMGVVFHFFLGEEDDENHLFLAFTGIIVFASGAAWYLHLSPLLVSLVLGMVLGNTSRHARRSLPVIMRTHKPMVLLMLIFAGALWTPVSWPAFVLAVLYICLRSLGKLGGGWLAALSIGPTVRRDLGRGLLGHGEVAVAMALNLRLVYDGPFVDWVFTAVLVSMVLNELWSARLLKGFLIDAGDIKATAGTEQEG